MPDTDPVALFPLATTEVARIAGNVKDDQLDAPTPCTEYDVRRLLNHLLYWGPGLVAAARKQDAPQSQAGESAADLTRGDWAADLLALLDRLAAAWSDPAAWAGVTRLGAELPAAAMGAMTCLELVVHGWDLARATGQLPGYPPDLLRHVLDTAEQTAGMGRDMGMFGPEVPVPADAPDLDRVLALTGRDPAWRP